MTSTTQLMHEHEVRRQAMLQAMQLDVWLPRQPLVNAAPSRDDLLDWQTIDQVTVAAAKPAARLLGSSPAAAVSAPVAPTARPARSEVRVSVRDKLALATVAPSNKTNIVQAVELTAEPERIKVQAQPLPRFALQILRADNCLLLVDLPTGEPFQNRDPDYQLLKDMLRAARLTDQPHFLRQGTPFVWPMLRSGNLMGEQNAEAARFCVRDLLSVELSSEPTACIWLVGSQAVRFGSTADDTALYSLQPFTEGVQVWTLPNLESVLEQPLLKRDIWRSMCAISALWQAKHD